MPLSESPVVTPHLSVKGAGAAIEFYKRAFSATEVVRHVGPNDLVFHAELRVGESRLFVADEFPGNGPKSPTSIGATTVVLNVNVPDADTVFETAVAAGAVVVMPLGDQFWGERYGQLRDPWGHVWAVAKHIEDVPKDELERRAQAWFSQSLKK